MLGRTHGAVGALTSLAIIKCTGVELDVITSSSALVIGTLGGLLPDIDHTGSTLGKKIKIIGKILKHRGITHTVYFAFLTSVILFLITNSYVYTLCLFGSVLSHILGDMLTAQGVEPFKLGKLFSKKICIPILAYIPILERIILIGSIMLIGYIGMP